jgi:peptide/nickel transport system substrate-binding protein
VRRKQPAWLLALLLVVAIIASACGGDDDDGGGQATDTTSDTRAVQDGGTLVLGWEQEPDCVDWIGSCGGSSYGFWMAGVTTLARPYNIVKEGDGWAYEPSNLLTGEPEVETSPKLKITYKLNPEAVWSDGTKITSKDFKYLWDQIVNGEDIYDTVGYADIESVDDSDPATAVVTFAKPFADWKSLFGGGYGLYPSHLLTGKDRNAETANGYQWSAGPWKIESWNKGADLTLVPNENYWGTKPKLDKVVFRFITDTAAEFQAFKAGQVQVIYPQPQPDAVDQIKAGIPGTKSQFSTDTVNLEALWINNARAPFNDVKVRQALGYAIDRDALVNRLFGPLGVTKAMQTMVPLVLSDYGTTAWSKYKRDLAKVDELLTSAGYAKGSDGIYAKGGQKLTFEFKSTTGNKRRELTEQIIQTQLKEAGFEMTINNQRSGDLFGDQLPKGDFQVALYAGVLTTLSPAACNNFCSKNIPTAPQFSGQNWTRTNVPAADPFLLESDASLDTAKRIEGIKKAEPLLADANTVLPLDPLPNVFLWSDKIVGPLEDNAVFGPLWNLELWALAA